MSDQTPPPSTRSTAKVRRSPRIWNFVLAGVVLGSVVALVLTLAFPIEGEFSVGQVFGFLFLFTGVIFGALGAVVALILDRLSYRRAREVEFEREQGAPEDD